MSINTLKKKKKKETISAHLKKKDHLKNYNIVNVCKNTIVNGDEDLQNCKEADPSS